MSKYEDWIKVGFEKLGDDFCKGFFRPQNESDIKCHLYHKLLATRSGISGLTQSHLVLSEWPCPKSQEAIDLAVVREKRGKKRLRPRVLIEIKETNKPERLVDSGYVKEKIQKDVDKLRRYVKEENAEILKYCKTLAIVFFFRRAGPRGIGTRTNSMMKKLQMEYDDIILLWGPM